MNKFILLLVLALIYSTFPGLSYGQEEAQDSVVIWQAPPGLLEGMNREMPSFELIMLDGKTSVHSQDFKGKILILDFWATWCSPCIAAFPSMQTLADLYAEHPEVAFLIVNTSWDNSLDEAKAFMLDHGYTFPMAYDERGTVVSQLGIFEIPTTFVIDKDGKLQFKHKGFKSIVDLIGSLRMQIGYLLNQH